MLDKLMMKMSKLMIKLSMRFMCYQLKRKVGLGKRFQHGLDSKNITTDFSGVNLMYLPVYVYIDEEKDKYYFAYNGNLVGFGRLDQLDPRTIIYKDCTEFNLLYQYIAAYAVGDEPVMKLIIEDDLFFDKLIMELKMLIKK